MGAAGVQIRGKSEVIKLHENLQLVCWSIIYGKDQLLQKYPNTRLGFDKKRMSMNESRECLSGMLDMLETADTYSVLQIRFYETYPEGGIKPKTEPDYCFNFTLHSRDEYREQTGYYQRDDRIHKLEEQILKLEAKLNEEDLIEEPKDTGLGGFLNGIMSDDRARAKIQDYMFQIADGLFKNATSGGPGKMIPLSPPVERPASVGSVSDSDPILIDQNQHIKLQSAIDVLVRIDPQLGDHIEKIAVIANQDRSKYDTLIQLLNSLS